MRPEKETKEEDVQVETSDGTPVKTGEQLKLEGFKPKAIDELDTDFDAFLKAKASKKAVDQRLKDAKAKLGATMKKHKQPVYGYRTKGETFVATLVEKDIVTVKTASTEDRN